MLEPFVSENGDALLPPAWRSALGRPVWSRHGLLRDLELRLGLSGEVTTPALRIQAFATLLAAAVTSSRAPVFFAASLEVDRLGTAETLLAWRDELLLAGWEGSPIGVERVDALALADSAIAIPFGMGDRLRAVEAAIGSSAGSPYRSITLLEPLGSWPFRWQRVLRALSDRGTRLHELTLSPHGAPLSSDLGRLQARLRGRSATDPVGDGSLVLLSAETTGEAAELVAAWLAESTDLGHTVVLRGPDAGRLDAALERRGLSPLGSRIASTARGPLAVLPLMISLATEPKDPALVLDLLSLPLGPFQGKVGRELGDALASWPGFASAAWIAAWKKVSADSPDDSKLARITSWIEAKAVPADRPAPKLHWQKTAEKVGDWARGWLSIAVNESERAALGAIIQQVSAFDALLAATSSTELDLVDARRLVDLATSRISTTLHTEAAGRLDHVDGAQGLCREVETLVWWGFTSGAVARPRPSPWRLEERAALAKSGIFLADPADRLRREAASWGRAIQSPSARVLLVEPRMVHGEAQGPHPLLDEMIARAGFTDPCLSVIRKTSRRFEAKRVPVAPLELVRPRREWRLPEGTIALDDWSYSVTALDSLLGCPLRWVLEKVARLRNRPPSDLSDGPLLAGLLGHRLVERLHSRGAWTLRGAPLRIEAERELEQMLAAEATSLILPGQLIEADQLRRQLVQAMVSLGELLEAGKLRVKAVEQSVTLPFLEGTLYGRLDLLLIDEQGRERLIDLKWGGSGYEQLLRSGNATQLAAYAEARRPADGQHVPAAYFSLASGRTFALEPAAFPGSRAVSGPSIDDTWKAAEKTARVVREGLRRGHLPVVGTDFSPTPSSLLDRLGIEASTRDTHLNLPTDHACTHCALDALCGRRWPSNAENA